MSKKYLLAIGAALVALVLLYITFGRDGAGGVSYATAPLEKGDIFQVVDATGTINAVITVQVGSQVSGVISELHADFNSHVTKGDVIAQINPALFQGSFAQAKADLEDAIANVAVAAANVVKAKASQRQTKEDYQRNQGLTKSGAVSAQALELSQASSESADAQVTATEAQEQQARAQVEQKRAAVQVAQTNLDYTTIRAPIDGTVVARTVDVGQTVAASLQAPTLFTIAQDLTKMQVYAKTDESDVGGMKPGQRVTFKVDAYPRETFEGTVSQVRMNSTVVQNVVTYDTIIDFDNPQRRLFPGMTAYVSIPVATALDVIRLPNAALRFKPDLSASEIQKLYKKADIPEEGTTVSQKATGKALPASRGSAAKAEMRVVWKLRAGKTLEPVRVKTGITDHTDTELMQVVNGNLNVGDSLITGVTQSAGGSKGNGPAGPRRT
ncbi:MAG: efflux RND transporter periplasmic adaptor subunit [Chthoniobacterales bacterium]|nr:efflux RND transporter periplasmic adaptor subunit [Chthoniobacterales bacterium]